MSEEHHHHHHHHHRTQILIWRIVGVVFLAVQATVSTFLAVSLIRIGIIEEWMVILVVLGLIILCAGCAVPLFFKRRLIIAVRLLCILVSILVITGGIFAYRYTDAFDAFLDKVSLGEVEEASEEKKGIMSEPFIVYISGSDSRISVDDPNARSDVNIVMVVNPVKEKILLATIPRDTYLQLHGTEGLKDKLTHAGLYGVEMSEQTIEDFLEISIDYTVKVSFDTVVRVVDELDGIDIESDVAMTLKVEGQDKRCVYVEGVQHVDGDCALRFARERKTYWRGDLHRIENQQVVLTAIIDRLSGSKDYLLKVPEILTVAGDSFETSFTRNNMIEIVRTQLVKGTKWQVDSMSIEVDEDHLPTYSMGEDTVLFVFIPHEDSVQTMKDKIKEYLEE